MKSALLKTLSEKIPAEGKTDLLLRGFVPGIILISVITFFFLLFKDFSYSDAMVRSITILVISCPCALGIAIPLTRVVGIFIALKKGVLIKDFKAFEIMETIDTVVFDKTGTLTCGKWSLLEIVPADEAFSKREILELALGLEQKGDHPVAVEIRKKALLEGISGKRIDGILPKAGGVEGVFHGRKIRIGNGTFLKKEIENQPSAIPVADDATHLVSRIYLGLDGRLIAVLLFGDEILMCAKPLLEELSRRGIALYMLSGDEERSTRQVAELLSIPNAHGGMLPKEKAGFVRKLTGEGKKVMMVGDGVNDALALAASALSVGIYSGYPLGKEAVRITLMKGDPSPLIDFFDFSKSVNRKIRQNLFVSFIYNMIAIPIAISGFLNPLIAVSAMLLSSLSVVLNVWVFVRRKQGVG